MNHTTGPWWLRWLPADCRAGVQRRALIVWGVAALIALSQRFLSPEQHPIGLSLVYSYAISTAIWFLMDPMRIVLRRWLHAEPPHYWTFNAASVAYLLLAIVVGYAIGTSIGDAVAGHSTWDLMSLSPARFWRFLLGSVAISAGFVFFFYHREKAHALERLATEARLKLMESQLEPHMLFNTLANLRVLIRLDPDRAVDMLDRLNDYLRATLAASRTDSHAHTLALEFQRLDDYLALMAVRMGPRLRARLDLPEALRGQPVPPLLLQPLVENAIRHGLEPHVDGGDLVVSARQDGDWLWLTVRDSGAGFEPAAPAPGRADSGFGLGQVRERVAGVTGGSGQVRVDSQPGQGTTVRIGLPLEQLRVPVSSTPCPDGPGAPP
jgi:signal transduction histidine kinase